MVATPVTQLLTALDYEDRGVRGMHAVLIELGQILGPYKDAVVVVGGAVPYLLLRGADPPHVGTLDIDLISIQSASPGVLMLSSSRLLCARVTSAVSVG
jgi:hypothetical protein